MRFYTQQHGNYYSSTTEWCTKRSIAAAVVISFVSGQTTALLTTRPISDRIGSSAKRSFQSRGVNAATSLAG